MLRRSLVVFSLLQATACVVPTPNRPTPTPAPSTFRLQVYVHDAGDQPLTSARVYLDKFPVGSPISVGADAGAAWTLPPSDFNVCGLADGYVTSCAPVPLHRDVTLTLILAAVPPPPAPVYSWPPAQARSQLAPFPPVTSTQPPNPHNPGGRYAAGVWSSGPYDHDLPFTPPDHPEIDFHRGNFSGVRCAGLSSVDGGASDPSHLMTWDLPKYSVEDQLRALHCYDIDRAYTHFLLSIPQARNAGRLTDDGLVASAVRAKAAHQFVVLAVYGGDGENWGADILPWLDKLVALHAVDELVTCWQCDQHYTPWDLLVLTKQVGEWAHAHGLKVSQHWMNDAVAWWNADDDARRPNTCLDWTPTICSRFDYHRVVAQWVDYQYVQVDTEAPISDPNNGGLQWALAKILQSFTTEQLVIAEDDAQAEFDDPAHRTEDDGDLKGYLLLCARGFGKVLSGGYMNGARLPNGRVF